MLEHTPSIAVTDYSDEDIPLGPSLGTYFLHSHEWRMAFLTRLTEVGYIGLIEASSRVYDCLIEPRDFHCALIAQIAGVSGSGKRAIFNALGCFLDDYLSMPPVPARDAGESLEAWHIRVAQEWDCEREREAALVAKFSRILNGEIGNSCS